MNENSVYDKSGFSYVRLCYFEEGKDSFHIFRVSDKDLKEKHWDL